MQFHAIYTTVPRNPHYIRSFNIDLKRPIVLARWPNIELLRLFLPRNNVLTYFSNDQRSGPPKAEGIPEEIFAAFQ